VSGEERRVALAPYGAGILAAAGHEVSVERGRAMTRTSPTPSTPTPGPNSSAGPRSSTRSPSSS
jgi:hypothetical protein